MKMGRVSVCVVTLSCLLACASWVEAHSILPDQVDLNSNTDEIALKSKDTDSDRSLDTGGSETDDVVSLNGEDSPHSDNDVSTTIRSILEEDKLVSDTEIKVSEIKKVTADIEDLNSDKDIADEANIKLHTENTETSDSSVLHDKGTENTDTKHFQTEAEDVENTDTIDVDKTIAIADKDKTMTDKSVAATDKDESIADLGNSRGDTEIQNSEAESEDMSPEDEDEDEDEDDLTPEDEDMVILKLANLGGILEPEEIAEIRAEEKKLEEEGVKEEEKLTFEPIPMPTDFDSYDRDRDGRVAMEELTDVTGAFENVSDVFKLCDRNGDGFIDREEFNDAPWDLSGKPPEGGLEQL